MASNRSLLILPGDGIGAEAMAQVRRIIAWLEKNRTLSFDLDEDLVGGCSIDAHGVPVTDAVMDKAFKADAVLLGAVGGPKWDNIDFSIKPERGLLRLRKDLELFANLRPAVCFDALADASSLKREVVGITNLPNGQRRGVNTQVYDTEEIRRVVRVAFDIAKARPNGKVTSSEKANVMESGILWREEAQWVHDNEYADIPISHMYADNCAMQLVRNPKQFDVIVTDNLFGDVLSDIAAMLTGSLGMLPSASLGAADANGKRRAMYEPVHGSAPDIAGQNLANPIATILSFAMALRYSYDLGADADLVENAVQDVLAAGYRTGDIMQPGMTRTSTTGMGDAILAALDKLAA